MTKKEYIKQCAIDNNLSQRQVSDVLNYTIAYIKSQLLSSGIVRCFGLGKLKIVDRTSRKHYDFQTGGLYPARNYRTIKFTPSADLTQEIND